MIAWELIDIDALITILNRRNEICNLPNLSQSPNFIKKPNLSKSLNLIMSPNLGKSPNLKKYHDLEIPWVKAEIIINSRKSYKIEL